MKIFKIYIPVILLFITSCGRIDFTYKDDKNLTNPIYNKTIVSVSGKEIPFVQRYISTYIGNGAKKIYGLEITIAEEKIKRSVQSNQAVAKMDYNLEFFYSLRNLNKNCIVYEKSIFTNFAYVPKSDGYNFGSDESLDQMYKLATKENIREFIRFVSGEKFICK